MQLEDIKNRWNEVLDLLLEMDRVTWLSFFDARLVSFENNQLTLDFADSQKFANPHDFKKTRNPSHTKSLIEAIERVFGFTPTIIER
ncbi:hypothetical protein B1s21122_01850 [Candidatus Nanopelagicus limnes]|jgi:hypothetical protein|uniref:Uncharacterized protein n=1 Tax=Candidatus Nanopelagicus limnae TaxID=1884634 RepID=A0A249JX44_9ACTN|nr:hypothetical protein [Candidatus Nanopelagicus limnes]ASY09098.1 hypothetical protein B1s21122_01850 [Candidatus Nanopelagicus limnes]